MRNSSEIQASIASLEKSLAELRADLEKSRQLPQLDTSQTPATLAEQAIAIERQRIDLQPTAAGIQQAITALEQRLHDEKQQLAEAVQRERNQSDAEALVECQKAIGAYAERVDALADELEALLWEVKGVYLQYNPIFERVQANPYAEQQANPDKFGHGYSWNPQPLLIFPFSKVPVLERRSSDDGWALRAREIDLFAPEAEKIRKLQIDKDTERARYQAEREEQKRLKLEQQQQMEHQARVSGLQGRINSLRERIEELELTPSFKIYQESLRANKILSFTPGEVRQAQMLRTDLEKFERELSELLDDGPIPPAA